MANGVLAWNNFVEISSITSNSEVITAPASNLASPQGGFPWLSTFGDTTAEIYFDMLESRSVRAFGIFRTNFSITATVRYRLGTTLGGSEVLDTGNLSGVVAGVNQHVYVHPTSLSARYLRITIADSSNTDAQLRAGMAFCGNAFEPTSNFSFTSNRSRENRLDVLTSAGGHEYPQFYWVRRQWSLSWDDLSDSEVRQNLEEVDKYARMGYNILFVPDYEDSPCENSVYGLLRNPGPFAFARVGFSRYGWNAEVTERL